MADAGYQIRNKFYPFPAAFRLLDSVLIRELTGMTWDEFVNGMPDEDDPDAVGDPSVMSGLIGVAIWQANPTWPRAKVCRYVQGITMDEVEAIGMDTDDEEEVDGGPPAVTEPEAAVEAEAGKKTSEAPAPTSESGSDSTSLSLNQKPSGTPELAITPKS